MAGVGSDKLVDIVIDERKLRQIEMMLRGIPKAMPRLISRSLNRTISPTRKDISAGIRQEINATAKRVNERLTLKKATFNLWVAAIHISRRRLPVMAFGVDKTRVGKNKPKVGISYKIKKQGGRETIPGSFIATVRNKSKTGEISEHTGVMMRKGKSRLPIRELWGPSIGQVFEGTSTLIARVTAGAYKRLEYNINSQLQFLLSKSTIKAVA